MTRFHHIGLTVLAMAIAATAQAPSWVDTPPRSSQYLIGIASARITGNANTARNEAFASALAILAAQLSVDVEHQTSRHLQESLNETRRQWSDDFSADVKTTSALRLEGVEVVDRYKDDERVWIYLRVHEARLRQLWHERAQASAARQQHGLDILRDPNASEAAALRAGLTALGTAVPAGGPAVVDGHDMRQQLLADLCQRLAYLELRPHHDRDSIGVDVRRHGARGDLAGLPVRLAAGGRERLEWTDRSGRIRVPIGALHRMPPMTVDVRLDLQALTSVTIGDADLPLPSTRIRVTRKAPAVLLRGRERTSQGTAALQHLRPELEAVLQQAGVDIVTETSAAQQVMDINAHTYRGSQVGGLYFAWLDLSITVTDVRTGVVLYRGDRRDIKGAGADHDRAIAAALRQATGLLREAVFTSNERDRAHVDSMGASLHP